MNSKKEGQLTPLVKKIRRYFFVYGGWVSVVKSPFFILALLVSAVSYRNWLDSAWTDKVYDLIPSILGFSLGTYAILFSIISSNVKIVMRSMKNGKGVSAFEQVNAAFFHFIFVQCVCLIWAFFFDGNIVADVAKLLQPSFNWVWWLFVALRSVGAFLGYLMMVYSITLVIAAALAVYRLALISDPAENLPVGRDGGGSSSGGSASN